MTFPEEKHTRLIALIVGVAHYQWEGLEDLPGCLNDIENVKGFLSAYQNGNESIRLIQETLSDMQATRENILEKFSIFNQAENGDICLFYFSGHGTQVEAPEVFDEPNNLNQAIVCYCKDDSSTPLIIDKELSYLIHQVTQNKTLHFLVISDCCHAGSNTKSPSFLVKGTPNLFPNIPAENYYGYEHYNKVKSGGKEFVKPPRGGHIKLAASMDHQEAKQESCEQYANPKSLFTRALFDVVQKCGGKISYNNLVSKVRAHIQYVAKDQSPEVDAVGLSSQAKQQYFLSYSETGEPPKIVLRKTSENERLSNEWIVEVGHLHGITANDQVLVGKQYYGLRKIYDTFSHVSVGMIAAQKLNEDSVYLGELIAKYDSPLQVAFSSDCQPKAIDVLSCVLSEQKTQRVEIVERGDSPTFIVSTDYQSYGLNYCDSKLPMFKRPLWENVEGMRVAARIFLTQLESLSKYLRLISLENHRPGIAEDDILITLEHPNEPYRYQEITKKDKTVITQDFPDALETNLADSQLKEPKPLDRENERDDSILEEDALWHEEHVFRYFYDQNYPGGPWFSPAFQLQVLNQSEQIIWVSILYCGSGYQERAEKQTAYRSGKADKPYYPFESKLFCSTNQFLRCKAVLPQEKVLMEDKFRLESTKQLVGTHLIELSVLDDYLDNGWSEIKDTIKVFVSNREFKTDFFNFEGVEINTDADYLSSGKSLPPEEEIPTEGWRTYTVDITIIRPIPLGQLRAEMDGPALIFGPLGIRGHKFFRAMVIASTMEELLRGTAVNGGEQQNTSTKANTVSPKANAVSRILHPCDQLKNDYALVELIMLSEGIGRVEGCSVIEFFFPQAAANVTLEYPLCINLDIISHGVGWQIKAVGYDSTEKQFIVLDQRKKGDVIEIHTLPRASRSLIPGLSESIKIFFVSAFYHPKTHSSKS